MLLELLRGTNSLQGSNSKMQNKTVSRPFSGPLALIHVESLFTEKKIARTAAFQLYSSLSLKEKKNWLRGKTPFSSLYLALISAAVWSHLSVLHKPGQEEQTRALATSPGRKKEIAASDNRPDAAPSAEPSYRLAAYTSVFHPAFLFCHPIIQPPIYLDLCALISLYLHCQVGRLTMFVVPVMQTWFCPHLEFNHFMKFALSCRATASHSSSMQWRQSFRFFWEGLSWFFNTAAARKPVEKLRNCFNFSQSEKWGNSL